MDTKTAKLMLENLVDRVERNPKTGKRYLGGAISDREFEAIEFALAMMDDDSTPITPIHPVSLARQDVPKPEETKAEPKEIGLNLASLERDEPDNKDVRLCLDFGTAMSKAFVRKESDDSPLDDDLLGLPLGQRAKEPNMVFPVSSTLYIDRDNKVYFGPDATKRSISGRHSERLRFDSPKQHMSRGGFDSDIDTIVDKKINPTSIEFTKRELITLYLSFLTDLACSELACQKISRYVLRRFAMPCWKNERTQWAESQMKKMLAKAQILADSFSDKWSGGLDVALVREALDAIERLDELPEYLIGQGVPEAIAAAASSLRRGAGERRLYMVIDVGAGTTDYGLFVIITPNAEDDRPKILEVPGTTEGLRQGGDTIDTILIHHILEQEKVKPGDAEYDHVNDDLRLRARILKENMFREGSADYSLSNDSTGSVDVDNFLNNAEIIRFEETLKESFRRSLEKADQSWIKGLADRDLTIVLTGGGAGLPIVNGLRKGSVDVHGTRLHYTDAPDVPSWIIERYPELKNEYPQLAVSIGGTAEELPKPLQYRELGIPDGGGPPTLVPQYK